MYLYWDDAKENLKDYPALWWGRWKSRILEDEDATSQCALEVVIFCCLESIQLVCSR